MNDTPQDATKSTLTESELQELLKEYDETAPAGSRQYH